MKRVVLSFVVLALMACGGETSDTAAKPTPKRRPLVAAAKTRTTEEVKAAIDGGVTHVGHNYVQEAEKIIGALGRDVKWHLIGHLQRNKAKKAAEARKDAKPKYHCNNPKCGIDFEVPAAYTQIGRLMRVNLPQRLAADVYFFVVSKNGRSYTYATIIEIHHPDYLSAADLKRIYGEILFDNSKRSGIEDFIGPPPGQP